MSRRDRPGWQQPMLWLVVALPLLSIAAAAATIAVAVGDGGTDTVGDAVRRIAQVQLADSRADAAAAQRAIRLRIERQGDAVRVRTLAGVVDRRTTLQLTLRHPARASGDVAVSMPPLPAGAGSADPAPTWNAVLAFDAAHDWNVELAGEDWRVVGRWRRGAMAAELTAAWPATVAR